MGDSCMRYKLHLNKAVKNKFLKIRGRGKMASVKERNRKEDGPGKRWAGASL